jgi:hypothetical protein
VSRSPQRTRSPHAPTPPPRARARGASTKSPAERSSTPHATLPAVRARSIDHEGGSTRPAARTLSHVERPVLFPLLGGAARLLSHVCLPFAVSLPRRGRFRLRRPLAHR